MRSKKNKKKLIIAIVLGLIATVSVFSMVNGQKAQVAQLSQQLAAQQAAERTSMQAQPVVAQKDETTSTILAKTDIKVGDIITINKIEKKQYKKSELPPDFFVNENFVLGKTASQDILAGKIINNEDILAASQNSFNIPPGMRAITIPNSAIQGLASYIYVGSKIDLITVKSPPVFIAQNIKIIALESDSSVQQTTPPPAAVPTQAAAPAQPAQPGQPVAAASNLTAAPSKPVVTAAMPIPSTPPAMGTKISADKATGITVLVPASMANKLINAMIEGKLQVIMRGNNDDKIVKQAYHSSVNITSLKTGLKLPPPPSGTGKLPSLPGVPSSITAPPVIEKPKVEVEIIEAGSKRQVSFDDSNGTYIDSHPNSSSKSISRSPSSSSTESSKSLKDLLKMPN